MSTKTKNIAPKNYVIFGVVCILTVVLVFYLSMWYETRREYYKNNSVMSEVLAEINKTELSSYVLENPNAIIYIASSKDEGIKKFEKELKKFIQDHNLTNQFVYLDLSQPYNNDVVSEIKNLSSNNFRIDRFNINQGVNFIVFENGKVKAILHRDSPNVEMDHIKNFMNVYEVVEE